MNTIFAEYVWVDGYGNLRSKNRLVNVKGKQVTRSDNFPNNYLKHLSHWNYDGSSTGQADTSHSEIILKPVRCFFDPFEKPEFKDSKSVSILVMCDTYTIDDETCNTNERNQAKKIFDTALQENPWFGMEQEFFIMDVDTNRPLGFPEPPASPRPQGPYYCSIGAENAFGRSLVNEAYRKSYHAGITVSGMNGEVAPGQWEIQVGPVCGISAGDELWMLRYILGRVTEEWSEAHNRHVRVDFGSKPVYDRDDSWNGSGMHVNFSTEKMRKDGGYSEILKAVDKLKNRHTIHIDRYGDDNHLRLTGKNETSDSSQFTVSVGGRGTSIRIPNSVEKEGKGYFEDRRPSSSVDPYIVTSMLFETCCVSNKSNL